MMKMVRSVFRRKQPESQRSTMTASAPEYSPESAGTKSERRRGDRLREEADQNVADFAEIMASFAPKKPAVRQHD